MQVLEQAKLIKKLQLQLEEVKTAAANALNTTQVKNMAQVPEGTF